MHIRRLIKMAKKPRRIIISFKKGTRSTVPGTALIVSVLSKKPKMTNNTKQILQMMVTLDRKETVRIFRIQ